MSDNQKTNRASAKRQSKPKIVKATAMNEVRGISTTKLTGLEVVLNGGLPTAMIYHQAAILQSIRLESAKAR